MITVIIAIGLVACQHQLTFMPTLAVLTATSPPSVPPLPSASPAIVSTATVPAASPAATRKVIAVGDDTEHQAQVRFVNASLDLAAADIHLGDQVIAAGVAFGRATNWQIFPSGSYTLGVGGITTSFVLSSDARLDLIVYGPASARRTESIVEDFSPINNGEARLEVFNAAPGTVGVQPFAEGTALSGFAGADYGQIDGPALIGAQSLALQFRATDASGGVQAVEFKSPVSFKQGNVYLYIVTGSPANIPSIVLQTPIGVTSGPTAATPSAALVEPTDTSATTQAVTEHATITITPSKIGPVTATPLH
jgi:hypothetical protein